jgi:hypothetical protein
VTSDCAIGRAWWLGKLKIENICSFCYSTLRSVHDRFSLGCATSSGELDRERLRKLTAVLALRKNGWVTAQKKTTQNLVHSQHPVKTRESVGADTNLPELIPEQRVRRLQDQELVANKNLW